MGDIIGLHNWSIKYLLPIGVLVLLITSNNDLIFNDFYYLNLNVLKLLLISKFNTFNYYNVLFPYIK